MGVACGTSRDARSSVAQHAQAGIEFVEQLTQLHKHAHGGLGYAPNPPPQSHVARPYQEGPYSTDNCLDDTQCSLNLCSHVLHVFCELKQLTKIDFRFQLEFSNLYS